MVTLFSSSKINREQPSEARFFGSDDRPSGGISQFE